MQPFLWARGCVRRVEKPGREGEGGEGGELSARVDLVEFKVCRLSLLFTCKGPSHARVGAESNIPSRQ